MIPGRLVRVTCGRHTVEGMIVSADRRVLLIGVGATDDGCASVMRVQLDDEGIYRSGITGAEVELVKRFCRLG